MSEVGTINYWSPERFAKDKYHCPADMWALGLIMHEMLSKTLPFDDVVAYISKPPKPLPDYVPEEI